MATSPTTMENQDNCPNSDIGVHRYFIFKVLEVFEPYTGAYGGLPFGTQLYEKAEYAIMGCNCGSTLKSKVKQQ